MADVPYTALGGDEYKPRGISVEWRDINVRVPAPKNSIVKTIAGQPTTDDFYRNIWGNEDNGELRILQDVTGSVQAAGFLAILGSSGSGKSTFLDVLSGRCTGTVQGQVNFNGRPFSPTELQMLTGYVVQDDSLFPNLTVFETLMYTARLRLPTSTTREEMEHRVNSILNELGLRKCKDSRIGGGLKKGISGGERRRVSVATQLVMRPSVLFLDEPTSGLDSLTAFNLVSSLKTLTTANRTVICTIHQPRSDLFELFDNILILSAGRTAFFGPNHDLIPYFANSGFECPKYSNPLDFAIDIATIDYRSEEQFKASRARVATLCDAVVPEAPKEGAAAMDSAYELPSRPSAFSATTTLISRSFVNTIRDPNGLWMRCFQLALFGMLLCLFIPRLGYDQTSIQNRTGLLYESVGPVIIIGILNAIALFPVHRNIFYRERKDGLYSPGPLVISHLVVETPFCIIATLFFSLELYNVEGFQQSTSHFLLYWFMGALLHCFGETFGCGMLMLIFDETPATNYATIYIMVTTLFAAGFLRSVSRMPVIYQWLSWATIQKYVCEVLAVNEYTTCWGRDCPMYLECAEGDETCFKNGVQYLDTYFPDSIENFHTNIGAAIGWFVAVEAFFYLAATWKKR